MKGEEEASKYGGESVKGLEDAMAITKTENSEYAVLIPENAELKEPVVEAEIHIHHRSKLSQHGIQIEGKRRSATPIDDTRNIHFHENQMRTEQLNVSTS